MSKYAIVFPVMIIDDDTRYVEPQKDLAYNEFGLELFHFKTWEEAQAELMDHFDCYDAIIVDGKGQLNKDSKAEDDLHLITVINWLKQEKGKGQIVPIFINTGFYEELSRYFPADDDILGVFKKGENQTLSLFSSIRTAIESKNDRKFELMYPDVFSIFNGHYLPVEKKKLLLQALVACQSKSCNQSDFNALRVLLETIYFKLKDIGVLEGYCFPLGRPNLLWCYRCLSGMTLKLPYLEDEIKAVEPAIFPKHIQWLVSSIKEVSSVLSHDYNDSHSSFALKSLSYAMMEVLLWLKKFQDKMEK